jgi:type II secretory pathway pseudopilin PulG
MLTEEEQKEFQQLMKAVNEQKVQIEQLGTYTHQLEQQLRQHRQEQQHALSVPSSNSALKPPKPDTFDGRNVDTFIYALEKVFQFHNVNDMKKVEYAVTYLRGSALRWYKYVEHQYQGQNAVSSWTQFVTLLRRHFEAANTETVVRNRLNSLRQLTTVSKYNDLFNGLIIEVLDIDDKSKIDMYCRGLKQDIRLQVSLKEPKSLEDAQSSAMNIDNILHASNGTRGLSDKRQHSRFSSSSSSGGAVPMEIGNTEEETLAFVSGSTKLSPEEFDKLRKEKKCFRCKRTGHVARRCNQTN